MPKPAVTCIYETRGEQPQLEFHERVASNTARGIDATPAPLDVAEMQTAPEGAVASQRKSASYCFTASTWITSLVMSATPIWRPQLMSQRLRLIVASKSPPHTSRLSIGWS
jgi:hypothetical protein